MSANPTAARSLWGLLPRQDRHLRLCPTHPDADLFDALEARKVKVGDLCKDKSEQDVLALLLTMGKLTEADIQSAVDFGEIVYKL